MKHELLSRLETELKRHPSVNHPLYERLVTGERLDRDQLYRLCAGYHDMAQGFLDVAAAGIRVQGPKDQGVMIAMTQTLHSELGFGDKKQVHHEHFLRFPESQGIPRAEILAAPPVPASEQYNNGLIEVYSGEFLTFLGAQAAFEMDAKEMIRKLHEFARRYTTDPDHLSYFHLHLWFEDAHVDWIARAMKRHVQDPAVHAGIEAGFYKELELKQRWLDGLMDHVYQGEPVRNA